MLRLAKTILPTPQSRLLDLGTGSGCIPLLLCNALPPGSPGLKIYAVDISPDALRLARDNAALCGFPPASESDDSASEESSPTNTFTTIQANFLSDDFLRIPELQKAFPMDILTANPPYISFEEYLKLPASVTNYEDPKALFGGPSGLEFYEAIARLICHRDLFKPHALVALEVGHQQAETVDSLLRSTGRVTRSDIWTDPWGKKRTVVARI